MIYTHQLPESPPTFVVLHCAACGSDYSANRGDYFMLPADMPHKCICGGILFITTRKTVWDHDAGQKYLSEEG